MEACLTVCNSLYRSSIRKRWSSVLSDYQSWKDAISYYKFNTGIANEMLIAKWIVNSYTIFSAVSHLVKYFINFYCHSSHTAPPLKINDKKCQSSFAPKPMNCKDQSLALEYSEILSAEFPVVHSERPVLYKCASATTRTIFFFFFFHIKQSYSFR